MFTHENICAEIKKSRNMPVTLDNTIGLAALVYLEKNLCAHSADDHGAGDLVLTQTQAKAWVTNMENADGTRGAHWTMEKTEEVRKQKGITIDPLAFWVTMNMMYSDYCMVAEKMGVNNAEFYICMAKAFLNDKDAQPDKLARYYEYIAEH